MNDRLLRSFGYLLLLLLIAFPIFTHLGSLPIRIWDEARQAVSAYEMMNNGNFIVVHFAGEPDMWSTKPPLLIWLQAICMKLFGVNETAVRLPAAMAGFLTCIALIAFFVRHFKRFWLGTIAAFVLLTTYGFMHEHVVRTGDYDALLVLFTTLSGLTFFAFCESQKVKHLYLFFLFSALAVLTKGIAGLIFAPALVIYIIWLKKLPALLRNRHFYIGLLGSAVLVVGYFLLREVKNPGFLQALFDSEVGGRYLTVIDGHQAGFWFYFENLINVRMTAWYLMIPCGFLLGIFHKNERLRRLAIFTTVMVVVYFLVISTSQTKIEWYDAPLFPFLAILIAIAINYVFELLGQSEFLSASLKRNVLPYLFLFLVFIVPYQNLIDKVYLPEEPVEAGNFYDMSHFLQDASRGHYDLNNYKILNVGYHGHLLFYVNIMQDKGVDVEFGNRNELKAGDKVAATHGDIKHHIDNEYNAEVIGQVREVTLYSIRGMKNEE